MPASTRYDVDKGTEGWWTGGGTRYGTGFLVLNLVHSLNETIGKEGARTLPTEEG